MDERLRKEIQPIYEQIGAIVQNSQHIEFSIKFALTLLKRLESKEFSDEEFEGSMDFFSHKTLGRLISEFKKVIELNDDEINAVKLGLDERNYIIHNMFFDKVESLATPEGRIEILERVQEARKNMSNGFRVFQKFLDEMLESNGIEIDVITESVKREVQY